MYLKSLVLKGFKSFADKSVLGFEPGLTAVVGPNGSGKSNVSDAVLWVLGERNAKNLRGQQMEDVIFAGSSARKAVSVAEVELVLDNSDGTLPVDFAEVSIARRMYRSGESEYLINGTVARRLDVLDILHDSGIGTGTHSIIAQGHLASILQSHPEDRRALIEEAAGVLKHKQRKAKSERKLARMDDSLDRIRDIVSEVERQVRPLERKAKRALRYRELSAERSDLALKLAVSSLRDLQVEWEASKARLSEANQAISLVRKRIDAAEKHASELQQRLQTESLQAGQAASVLRRSAALTDKLDSHLLLLHERKRSLTSYLSEMQLTLDTTHRAFVQAQEALTEARVAADKAVDERAQADEALTLAQNKTQSLQEQKRLLQKQNDQAARTRREALGELEAVRARIAQVQKALAENQVQEQLLSEHADQMQERMRVAEARVAEAQQQYDSARLSCEEAKVADDEMRYAVGEAMRARDDARIHAEEALTDLHEQQAHLAALEAALLARQAENPLRNWASDVAKRIDSTLLLERLSIDVEHAPLVSRVLSDGIWAIVARDKSEAFEIINEALLKGHTGSASVVFPSVLSAQHLEESEKTNRLPEGCTPLLRFVSSAAPDATLDRALTTLLNDVVVARSLTEASRAVEQGYTAITHEGVLITPSGQITLVRKGDEQEDTLLLRSRLDEARVRVQSAEQVREGRIKTQQSCEEKLREMQAKSLTCSQTYAQAKGTLSSAEEALGVAKRALQSLEVEAREVKQKRDAARAHLEAAMPDAQALDARVELLSLRIESAKEDLDRIRDELSPIRLQADNASNELAEAKLAAATAKERTDYALRMVIAREQDVAQSQRTEVSTRENMHTKSVALSRIDPLLEIIERLASAARVRTQELEVKASTSERATDALHTQIEQARLETKEAHEALDRENEKLSQEKVQSGRLEVQVESAINTIVHDCNTPLEHALSVEELEDRATAERTLAEIDKKIESLGAINPEAAQEYEAVKARFDYLSAQLEDMLLARASLKRIVCVIDKRMKDDFIQTFEQVKSNFADIFATLFPGGNGTLELVDPDDPEHTGVEVQAQPQGKRILKMSLMSGGEKSLVALALLFAVYKTRSTPFYILDEVEAALDDSNLRRLVAYLDSIRHDTQFIMITHQRRTMEMADVLYGISMQSDGVTKVMSQRLDKALRYAEG